MKNKNRYVLIILFTLSGMALKAQQFMNFQGKIYQNGTPVNNNAAIFRFEIQAISWNQAFNNVSVRNGLYSVTLNVPQNIFDSANATRQMTVQYNGNYIDTILIYAPVERDPSVRRYIRDSVYWSYIRNKPTIDTSNTNELQTMSRIGDSLKLSNGGGAVFLPRQSDTLHSTSVNGIFTVFDTTRSIMVTVPQTGTIVIGAVNQVYWQSFKATANGKLRQLKLTVGSSGTGAITVNFYSGTGNTTPALAFKTFTVGNTASLQTLDVSTLSGGLPFISINNGQVYTFEIKPATGNTISILTDPANPYADGISGISNTTDIPFELSIDKSAPPCFTFDNNCRVGIGTATPTAQLDVKGRVKDLTGFLMPVGSVISYAGRNIPQGWLLCDGRSVSRTTYSDLFEAIDSSWGSGNTAGTFNLPDMRGQFLRGVDTSVNVGTNNTDPNHNTRTVSNIGGNSGNNVGSKQGDIFGSHSHNIPGTYWKYVFPNGVFKVNTGTDGINQPVVPDAVGGLETRPKNVYVYYIIKY